MFLITNRCVDESRKDLSAFGSTLNEKGALELRVAEATRRGGSWRVNILPDECTPAMIREAGIVPEKDEKGRNRPVYASRYVARRLQENLRARQNDNPDRIPALTLFVHGYNNDVGAVLDRAQAFEDLYGVEVVAFTWPANGGGARGVLSYLSDKRDALASVGAFDRVMILFDGYLKTLSGELVSNAETRATRRYGKQDNAEGWNSTFTNTMNAGCPFTLNLILHSMGNYLFKHYMNSTTYSGNRLIFDNIVMAAADTNNEGHAGWVDRIQCRRRLYVTINENDVALRASRMKAGEEQKARLGHWPYSLDSRRAVYVDFTDAERVGDSHAYFEGRPAENGGVRQFFDLALNGLPAEKGLDYDVARNLYFVR